LKLKDLKRELDEVFDDVGMDVNATLGKIYVSWQDEIVKIIDTGDSSSGRKKS
jgi:hypothetical protein